MTEGTTSLYKESDIQIRIGEDSFILHKGESIFDLLLRQERIFLSFCGGKGRCGRCRIRFLQGIVYPSSADRIFLTAEEIRRGVRLACTARPTGVCRIELLLEEKKESKIISGYQLDEWKTKGENENWPKNVIAVDIGTTTLAMQLIDTSSGEILTQFCRMNPQRSYGPDVISRIEADTRGEGERLNRLIRREVETGIKEMLLQLQEQTVVIAIAGNTTMQHLFLGFSTRSLGEYPFQPVDLSRKEFELCGIPTVFLPGISAFVGADIVAGIYALRMCQASKEKKATLLIDLGTNGEMAIGNGDKLLVCATAAGPAFEGRGADSLEGTDRIKLIATLLEEGILDASGLLADPYFEKGYPYKNTVITQEDVRAIQMAKAAICAGIKILMREYPLRPDEIDQVYLAGGFGYYLDTQKAARIGLIPDELCEKSKAVGNTSLMGAYLYGRNPGAATEVEALVALAEPINLAEQPGFEQIYLESLDF